MRKGARFFLDVCGNTVQLPMDSFQAARQGGEAAFLALFDEHHLALYRFACRLTGSQADAEDIVQECFLELLRPGCSYDPARTPMRTYLFGVVRNQCLKRLRRSVRPAEDGVAPLAAGSPESLLLEAELEGVVASAVRALPDTQREVLLLAHYERMPLAEIARVMELDIGAVKSRLQRARARLKETLAVYATRQGRIP
jgi:RNA polymerase sigma-70 factor (ECF subfamily)